ncbi:MAG TPA: DUF58 domain-containing protein [Gaiellaceae bacterium]|nr:DUF58 domain-containing protein [Gaiellaceae bacterium]
MLTDRGRWILAFGGAVYLAAWAFGTTALYPIGLGLVLAVAAAALWVRLLNRPMRVNRVLGKGEHLAGDDIPVRIELEVAGPMPSGALTVVERIAKFGEVQTVVLNRHGRLRGVYILDRVPRGRYPIESAKAVLEDPFGLERVEIGLPAGESVLVYPRLVELDALFSDSGARAFEGRRLLLRRPTGFDLHSVRDYEQGESLRRVHWPTTAKRGHLMVKELEDAPRDETAVLLDGDAAAVVGLAPDNTFELQVQAAGSILKAHAARGRRAALIVNCASRAYQRVHSFDGDWLRALEMLAAVEPDGPTPVASMLADESGPAGRALELTVVTSSLTPRLAERLAQRVFQRHAATLVYIDPGSFAGTPAPQLDAGVAGQVLRLQRAGVPVAIVRRGDDLVSTLGAAPAGAAVG